MNLSFPTDWNVINELWQFFDDTLNFYHPHYRPIINNNANVYICNGKVNPSKNIVGRLHRIMKEIVKLSEVGWLITGFSEFLLNL